MDINSERMTLRGVDPILKKALMRRAEAMGEEIGRRVSMERTILTILKQNLTPEIEAEKSFQEFIQSREKQPVG